MDVDEISENFEDIEVQNLISYDRQKKNDRQNFTNTTKDKHLYPKANSIADSKKFLEKNQKYMLCISTIIYKNNSWR